jgi:ribosomal protein L22
MADPGKGKAKGEGQAKPDEAIREEAEEAKQAAAQEEAAQEQTAGDEEAPKPKRRLRRRRRGAATPDAEADDATADAEADAAMADAEEESKPRGDAEEEEEDAEAAEEESRAEEAESEAGESEQEEAPAKKGRGRAAETTTARRRAPARRRDRDGPVVVRAQAKYVRCAPRKARLVIDHIRGKSVDEARAILLHTPRAASRDVLKLLDSCVANAESEHELLADELRVEKAFVDEGPTLKRYRPRALGRATRIRKRTSHMTITLTTTEEE